MALAPLAGQISTLAVHHGAVVALQEGHITHATRIESVANEIQELRNERRASMDMQEAIIKLQSDLDDIRKIYIHKIDGMEREIVNCKLVINQFMKTMERKYPVDLED